MHGFLLLLNTPMFTCIRPDVDHIVLPERAGGGGALEVPKRGVEANLEELARRAALAGTVHYDTAGLR